MKTASRRALSILLALAMALGLAAPALAAEPLSPVVFLAGFGTELYLNDGTPEEKGVLMGVLNADEVLGALGATLLDALLRPLAALRSQSHGADALSAFMLHWLGNLACDENGDSLYPVSNTSRNEKGRTGTYEGRPFYQFHFDWRLDPMETARALHAYIQRVKAETGSAKVNLHAISFGSVVCCAYLEQYGTGDLESLFLCVSAHGGLTLGEDLIQKKLSVSGKGLAAFLEQMIPDDTGLLAPALRAMECTGLLRLAEWLFNGWLGDIKERFYEQAVIPLLGQMPAVWAFVADDEVYENGKRLLLADTAKYARLIEKLDEYHYSVGNRTNKILRDAAAEIKVALVCGYDYAPIPLGGAFLYQSDFLIDTARESGGAVCAPYGQTLPADYVQAVADGHDHISGDRAIDASTCALPEQTWFVKGYQHQYEYSGAGIYPWFLGFSGQPTVWSDPAYPQFL
jgi:hypothetical protein